VGLIAVLYLASELSRGLATGGLERAEGNTASVVALERRLHVFHEAGVQGLVRHVAGLPTLLGYAYLTLHLAVTALVLVWVYRSHPSAYRPLRNTLALANAIAMLGYWLFPAAPPRLAGIGIGDTVSGATAVNLSSRLVSSLYNPYAAVPSMHAGFALIVGITVVRLARRPVVRVAGALYPFFVLLVIVGTGNHFVFDATAGAAVVAVAAAAVAAAARVPAAAASSAARAYAGSVPGGPSSSIP
jgi:hypothetical protein